MKQSKPDLTDAHFVSKYFQLRRWANSYLLNWYASQMRGGAYPATYDETRSSIEAILTGYVPMVGIKDG